MAGERGTQRSGLWGRMRRVLRRPEADVPAHLEEAVDLWKVSRRWTLAAVVAAFPLLLILDAAVDLTFSPVLPGLLALALLLVLLPPALQELLHARMRRRSDAAVRLLRMQGLSRLVLGLAAVWFLGWLVWGA